VSLKGTGYHFPGVRDCAISSILLRLKNELYEKLIRQRQDYGDYGIPPR